MSIQLLRYWLQTLGILASTLLAFEAQACTQCMRDDKGGGTFFWILGAMILLPYPVSIAVYRAIKNADQSQKPFK